MHPRKTSLPSCSTEAEGLLPSTTTTSMPKRQKTSTGDAPSFASSLLISKQAMAATRLQRKWRSTFSRFLTKYIVEEYLKPGAGATIEYVNSISFEALIPFLREKPTIHATKQCLQRIHYLATFRHGSPALALTPENVNVRVFLAGFMIAYRPSHVFESMGPLEKALLESAGPLIASFQRILECIAKKKSFQGVPGELTRQFPTLLYEYLKRFKAWKVPDEAKLLGRIRHALIALYQAEQHLPDDEPEDSRLRVEFRTQIERLRNKLMQIGGPEALAQFDAENGITGGGGPRRGGGGGSVYASLPDRMTNEQLAHELLLEPTFQLDEAGGCSAENPVHHRIRESFHQAFWDSLVDDLKLSNPCYVRVLRVLSEIRTGVADLAGRRETDSIQAAVDVDFIRRQVELGVYGWDSCKGLVVGVVDIIKRVQAPRRDAETQEKWLAVEANMLAATGSDQQPGALCKALEFMLDRVNAMRIDAANARLRLIAPVIRDHGIDYERGKFQGRLDNGSLTLQRTEEWIDCAVAREVSLKNVALADLVAGKPCAFIYVHAAAMLSLVAAPVEVVPETLLFDTLRLTQLQQEYIRIVDGATLLVMANHSIVGSNKNPSQAERLVLEDLASLVADGAGFETVIPEFRLKLESAGVLKDAAARGQLANELSSCIGNKSDNVRNLIAQRVDTAWLEYMKTPAPITRAKFIGAAGPVIPLIEAAAGKLAALAVLNHAVHLPTYNKLTAEAAARKA